MKLNIIGVLFAAGVGLVVASPAAADEIAEKMILTGNNHPEFDPIWVLLAALIAGFAAGYGVRSLVSARQHRRARHSRFGSRPSDRLQVEADNSHISIVPRHVGDHQSPPRPRTASRPGQSS